MSRRKPAADLLNPKPKGRFRRLRRQQAQAQKTGAPLKGTVVSPVSLNDEGPTVLTLRALGKGLTREQLSRHVWRCQDGRRIAVTDMRDAHLMNTMDMVSRQREAAHKLGVLFQSIDGEKAREAFRASARKAQWLMVLEAELLRRHPTHLRRSMALTKPTGNELYALPQFYDTGVLADDAG